MEKSPAKDRYRYRLFIFSRYRNNAISSRRRRLFAAQKTDFSSREFHAIFFRQWPPRGRPSARVDRDFHGPDPPLRRTRNT
jgi:hypothetical protein